MEASKKASAMIMIMVALMLINNGEASITCDQVQEAFSPCMDFLRSPRRFGEVPANPECCPRITALAPQVNTRGSDCGALYCCGVYDLSGSSLDNVNSAMRLFEACRAPFPSCSYNIRTPVCA